MRGGRDLRLAAVAALLLRAALGLDARALSNVDRSEAFPGYSEVASSPAQEETCEDKGGAGCAAWALGGECEKNPGYMHANCQLSCRVGACKMRPGFQEPDLPELRHGAMRIHNGRASEDGTRMYMRGIETDKVGDGHFRRDTSLGEIYTPGQRVRGYPWLHLSSIGVGTYLGPEDDVTDRHVARAIVESVRAGCNVLDTAINYRNMRGEKALGTALTYLFQERIALRNGLFISTKAGFFPPGDFKCRDKNRALEVNGHTMAPECLGEMLTTSLQNLGLDTVEILYLHNPGEAQLPAVGRAEFMDRLRGAFKHCEGERRRGRIQSYGLATWNSFRVPPESPDHLSLWEVVQLAEEVGGEDHGFRYIQLPINLQMMEAYTGLWQHAPVLDEAAGERGVGLNVLEAAGRLGVGVFASGPLGEGGLSTNGAAKAFVDDAPELAAVEGSAAKMLQVARSTPGLVASIVGHKSSFHYRQNLQLVGVPPLTKEDYDGLVDRLVNG